MKSLLRKTLRAVGYDIIRHVDIPEHPFNVLGYVIDARIAANQPVRFVQVGANDGIAGDPIRDSVIRHKLPGILVEPVPDVFAKLQANYVPHPGLHFEQCAIGERDGEMTLYRVRPSPELPEWLQVIASFDRNHLTAKKFQFKNLEDYVVPMQVPVLTVASLLKKHGFDGCDLLQVDTEGYDIRIVRSAIDSGLRPAIVNYEFYHAPPGEIADCKRFLQAHGYAFIDVGADTLALHTEGS